MMTPIKLAKIVHGEYVFLVSKSPDLSNINNYKDQLTSHGVKHLVKLSENEYNGNILMSSGIAVTNIPIKDGMTPSKHDTEIWLDIVKKDKIVAVHCLSGLGRAPLMVAIAMVKLGKIDPLVAITTMRGHIRGCMNKKQITYLTEMTHDRCCIM